MKIVISPWARALARVGNKPSPKNYPFWNELVIELKNKYPNCQIIQIGLKGEIELEGTEFLSNLNLKQLKELLLNCDLWISVDNFLQHYCKVLNKPGVVIWAYSDPKIFGYTMNKNILKDIKSLRNDQYVWWNDVVLNPLDYPAPQEVIQNL